MKININELIEKYRIYIISFVALSVAISYISLYFKGASIRDCFIGLAISMFFYGFGYLGGSSGLELQAQNPLCPLKVFNVFCQLPIVFFGIGGFLFAIMTPYEIIIATDLKAVEFPFNIAPAALGFVLSANKVRKKYIIEQTPRKRLFSKKTI
jgi:hypothetical protein